MEKLSNFEKALKLKRQQMQKMPKADTNIITPMPNNGILTESEKVEEEK